MEEVIKLVFGDKIDRIEKIELKENIDQQSINKIYSARKEIYNESNFKIKCNLMNASQIVNKIIKLYENSENKI